MAGLEAATARDKHVPAELKRLEQAVDRLPALIPVLGPHPPTEAPVNPAKTQTPLADTLATAREQVDQAADRIHSLFRRLEI